MKRSTFSRILPSLSGKLDIGFQRREDLGMGGRLTRSEVARFLVEVEPEARAGHELDLALGEGADDAASALQIRP